MYTHKDINCSSTEKIMSLRQSFLNLWHSLHNVCGSSTHNSRPLQLIIAKCVTIMGLSCTVGFIKHGYEEVG